MVGVKVAVGVEVAVGCGEVDQRYGERWGSAERLQRYRAPGERQNESSAVSRAPPPKPPLP